MADAPISRLQVLQSGPETTPGTLVAATNRVPFVPGSLRVGPDINTIRRINSGSLATSHGSSPGLQRPWLSYRERATYDRIVQVLAMFIKGGISGTGGAADKTWATITPSDSADDLKRYSYEIGGKDTWAEEEKLSGCVGDELTITWNKTDDVMLDVRLVAVRNTQAAKTGSLSIPAGLVPILGRLVRCYIDPTTLGSTSYGRAISGTIRVKQGTKQRYGSDGNDYPNSVRVTDGRQITFTLRVEYDTTTLRTAWRNRTIEKMRIEFPGPVLGGSNYNFRFDVVGTIDAAPIDEDEGVTILSISGTAEYDAGLAGDSSFTVVNSITALP